MLEFKQTIEEKAYNDMRELVGWRRLDPQQAQLVWITPYSRQWHMMQMSRSAWRVSSETAAICILS